jgi:hypothetical protein
MFPWVVSVPGEIRYLPGVNDALRPFVDHTHMHRALAPSMLSGRQQGAIATTFVLKAGVYAATLHAAALDEHRSYGGRR